MRRVFVVMLILLATGIAVGAWASKNKPAHAKAPSRQQLHQQQRAARSAMRMRTTLPATQSDLRRRPARRSSASNLNPQRQAAAAAQRASRSALIRSDMRTAENPPVTGIGLFAAINAAPALSGTDFIGVGDWNGDGIADLVAETWDSTNGWHLATLLGKGDGTFGDAVKVTTVSSGWEFMFGMDLNGDKNEELVAVNYDGSVSVYASDGSGAFTGTATKFTSGLTNCYQWWSCDYKIVDLARPATDGKLDLVLYNGDTYSEMLNDGAGGFAKPTSVDVSTQMGSNWSPALGDVNGDGALDLITEGYDSNDNYVLQVMLGTADGTTFGARTQYAKPLRSYESEQQLVADVDGDGKADVVSLDEYALAITVYYQDENGTFVAKGPVFAGDDPYVMSAGDINGDGKAEIFISDYYGGVVTQMGGDKANLKVQAVYGVGGWPWVPASIADFTGDGKLDLLVPNYEEALALLPNVGNGNLRGARFQWPIPMGQWWDDDYYAYVTSTAAGDLNGDGFPDVVAGLDADYYDGFAIFFSNGDGTLKPGIPMGAGGEMYSVAIADLNKDGHNDILVADENDYTLKVYYGDGKGNFSTPATFLATNNSYDPYGIAVADFNGDGFLDVAIHNDYTLSVLLNDGSGGLLEPVEYDLDDSRWDGRVVAADIDGDNKLDLVSQGNSEVEIFFGNGDGTFGTDNIVDFGSDSPYFGSASDIKAVDINKDGKMDLVATTQSYYVNSLAEYRDGVLVMLGDGTGAFAPTMYRSMNHSDSYWDDGAYDDAEPYALDVADLNGDGVPDIVVANGEVGEVGLLYGRLDSSNVWAGFYDPLDYPAALYGYGMAVADMNGDGAKDVVLGAYSDWEYVGSVGTLLNTGGAVITATSSKNPAAEGDTVDLSVALKPVLAGITAIPSGAISISDGTTKVGEGSLTDGAATIALTEPLTAGAHELTVAYLGDSNFVPAAALFVQFAGGPNDYDLSADKTSATITAGQSAVFTLTITPKNGFMGTVTFDCGTLPAGVTCGFTPSSVTPNGKDPVTVMLSIHTTAATTSAALMPPHSNSQLPVLATLWGAGVMGLVVVGGSRKRKAAFLISLLALAILLAVLVGCGGTRTITNTVTKEVPVQTVTATPAGQHVMTIMATSTGGTGKPLDITLNVE